MTHDSTHVPHPRLFVRWFVQYNPMFTASALCVLGGVLLVSRALHQEAVVQLTAILELYQWLVIGVAALLYRRLLERRPAAILGVIALAFLADPTLQLSALASSARPIDHIVTALWVVAFAAKLHALAYAFRLRLNASARVLPIVAAALAALVPNARMLDVSDRSLPAAVAFGVFALGVAFVLLPARVESRQALDDYGQMMFARLTKAAACIGVGAALYQVANALFAIGGVAMAPVIGALALVGVVAAKRESLVWVGVAFGAWLIAGAGFGAVVGAPLVAAALLLAARQHAPRVFVAGAFMAFAGVAGPHVKLLSGGHALDALAQVPSVVLVGALVTIALALSLWKRRAWSAFPALAIMYAKPIVVLTDAFAPSSNLQWGALLLASGFVLLPAGVVLHRRFARVIAADDRALEEHTRVMRERAIESAPSSPAAIPLGPIGTSAA